MATKNQGAGGRKPNGKAQEKQSSLSKQEKKEPKQADLTEKIKTLEDDNKRLNSENVTLKNHFDLREIIKALSTKGVKELDATEIAQDMIKMALKEADEKHSAEKKDMEKKHKQEIEKLSQNLQGEDQLPTKLKVLDEEKMKHASYITELESGDSKHSQETDKEIAKFREQNKELEREVGSLKAEKDELNTSITLLKTEKEGLKKTLEETKVLLRQKETEITNMKENVTHVPTRENSKGKHLEKEETKKDVNHSHQREKTALVDTKQISVEMQNLELMITELKQFKEESKNLKDKLKKTEELLSQKESEVTDMKKELANLKPREKDALLAEKQKKDAEIKTLQDENKALKQSEEKIKNLNEKLKKLEEEKDNLKQQVTALQKENDEVKYRLKESQSPSLSNVISANDNKAVQQLKNENERLRTRLSELAGAQMTLNNPNIADLSDAFRPTKLSEEYSQLYDNLWTDAFEEHGGKKEEDIIQMLGKTLLGSYKFCEKVCREFTVQLTNSSLSLPNSKPKTGDIPIVYKKQLQDMKKSFGVFLRNDVKESYRTQNTIEGGEKTKNYIDACVELCWLMVIQEPPVVIETPASKDSAFDSDTYRIYTKTGTKVDFVVWPALRLHQGGPLLTKGVAQGKN